MRELVAALAANRPEDRLELYGHRWRRPRRAVAVEVPPASARLHRRRLPARALALAARAGFGADRLLGGVDVLHWTDYVPLQSARAPVVATIHDTCFVDLPACYAPKQRRALHAATRRAVERAARLIVPCERVARDLERVYGAERARVDVVPHGCRTLPPVAPAQDLGRYVLFVGTLQPRKNLERLLQAFDRVHARHPALRLVVAGGRGWSDEPVLAGIARRDAVQHVPSFDARRLSALYRGALAVTLPSLGEGFGLPVLEAMACGRPLLVGAHTACSDLAQDAAVAVDPTDVDALAAGLQRLVEDDALRARLGRRGLERAPAFTWARAARATRAVYERAVQA